MAKEFTKYTIENQAEFEASLAKIEKQVQELSEPYDDVAKDFYKSEKSLFELSGPGPYPDFKNEKSRQSKLRAVGFTYPLLVRSGAMRDSITGSNAAGSINQVVRGNELVIGTSIPYAIFQQAKRPFIFVGNESSSATREQRNRVDRWEDILEDFILTNWKSEGFETK